MISKDILIVDDEDFIRDLLTDFLSMEGYNTASTGTAEAALNLLKTASKPFDLILLDRHLENSRAEEFIEQMKTMHIETPIILLTGDHEIGPNEAQKMGALSVVHKPFQIDDLLHCIRRTEETT